MRERTGEDWHAYLTKSSNRKIYKRCRFSCDRDGVFEVYLTALYTCPEADVNRFFDLSRQHGVLKSLPETEVKMLRDKVAARRAA